MSDDKDLERIYLEPYESDSCMGRQWCQDDIWDAEDYEGKQSTVYIREDIVSDSKQHLIETIASNKLLRAEIQSLEAELDSQSKAYGLAITENAELRSKLALAEQSADRAIKGWKELRREVENYRTFYIEVTNSDPVSSFVGGDPVGYLATNAMLSKLEKAIGE